ncbi:prolyl-tRNA synthetase associated domain-containing protein [Chromobacterium sp. IIBBL 290-4]|uniref:prolyl-tRNA synthetase associated domain-containing protein n=1 Tax=Chromobacterium sp. IIBBL 290-4 TaxID=2953890 RepID=UPI0020B6A7D2|nr:prolyl-tRNA synthetase associated domain-containing protein [Chromobacterium sp. IIBBL 290-4]UTH73554.1 prolyl-tRNA synthetase associated domain-containing protein [Chromobacterium sp. IIBBL 290-4]
MEQALYRLLDEQGIAYQRVEHPPAYTCEEATRLIPYLPGAECKNLFLCDAKGRRHFLVAVPASASVDIKALGETLGAKGLRFASPERLKKYLGLEPGSVTLLGAFHDAERAVHVVVDETLWANEAILCHPLVNTATLSVSVADLERLLIHSGHSPSILAVPRKNQP